MIQSIETTNHYLNTAFDQVQKHKPLSPKILIHLKQAAAEYQTNVDTLYENRNIFKKILYFFGFCISPEERAQLRCIRKITQLKEVAKLGPYSETKSIPQNQLREIVTKTLCSKDFLKLIAFSLKDNVSDAEVEEMKKYEGTQFYAPDAYFAKLLSDFSSQPKLSCSEKKKAVEVLKAFQFNDKVNWKSLKHQSFPDIYHNRPWFPAKAGVALHNAINKMTPGNEVVFSGTHVPADKSGAHAVLFSCKILDKNNVCIRLYNTGLAAEVAIGLSGMANVGWAWLKGQDADTAYRKNVKITVEQTIFTKEDILSDEFTDIFANELLAFHGANAPSGKELFPKYRKFVNEKKLDSKSLPNVPVAPQIKAQTVGNCGIASKLAYIEDTFGKELYNTFRSFVQRKIT